MGVRSLSRYLLNRPVEMSYVKLVVPKASIDRVVSVLQEAGAMHVEVLSERIEEYVDKYNRMNKLIDKISSLLSSVHGTAVEVKVTRQEVESLDLEFMERDVDRLYSEISLLNGERRALEEDLKYLTFAREVLSSVPPSYSLKSLNYRGKTLCSLTVFGRLESYEQLLKSLSDAHVLYSKQVEQGVVATLIYSSSVHEEVVSRARGLGLSIFEIREPLKGLDLNESAGRALSFVDKLVEDYRARIGEIDGKVSDKIRSSLSDLCKYYVIVENELSHLRAVVSARSSKYLTIVSGWAPSSKVKDLVERLRAENIALYYELRKPARGVDEPPTLLNNPPVVEWYEPIVKFIGIPRYWEWDPTPLVAYSFALFFGLMLGDMGFALALMLLTALVLDKFVSDPSNRDYVLFKRSIMLSSAVGFVVGALSGSMFSYQLYSLTDVFADPLKFLVLALVIGLIHVNVSHALTLVKALRGRDAGTAMSEVGLLVAEFFGIPYILKNMFGYSAPTMPAWLYDYALHLAILGLAILVVGAVKQMGLLGLLMWLFGVTGLLGDVLSYSRLAGVGLATVYLGASFNMLAGMIVSGLRSAIPVELVGLVLGALLASIVLAFGYLLNVVLSAIGCFVHSLRLCFVEFLSKFYEGSGYLFEPLRVVLRRRIVLE